MQTRSPQVERLGPVIAAARSRVLLRPFVPGAPERIKRVLKRVTALPPAEAGRMLNDVLAQFRGRHRDLEERFHRRFLEIRKFTSPRSQFTTEMQLLIGAYFCNEYAPEAAALFNPSIVPDVSQEGVRPGAMRFVLSLRATGEGHISSIEFLTGIIDKDGTVSLDERSPFVQTAQVVPDALYETEEFSAKMKDEGHQSRTAKRLIDTLAPSFQRSALLSKIARARMKKGLTKSVMADLNYLTDLAELNYTLRFPKSVPVSERVIFPVSSFESNGIEDARFVRLVGQDGRARYYATYTAYNGQQIMPLLLETDDFAEFRVRSLSGAASRNKGMALFPRMIQGHYMMIARSDGENLFCVSSRNLYSWQKPANLLRPQSPWEFIQIGNCGSPIETAGGWLLLTHGVGPVRRYCIGAILLDLDDPSKVIGRLTDPLIAPDESERDGYVPNVVYTCGAIVHNGNLVIPYAASDQTCRFARVGLKDLLAAMK